MASAQEAGKVRLQWRKPNNQIIPLMEMNVQDLAPEGGAADGALSSVKSVDERMFVPLHGHVAETDDILEVLFIADGADGIDVSDCIWSIPVTVSGLGMKTLSRGDFANPTPTDYTTVAAIPVVVGGYKVTEGRVKFGGGHIYLDMQDDTA